MFNRNHRLKLSVAADQLSKERNYWLNKLAGFREKNCIPYDDKGLNLNQPGKDSVKFNLPNELALKLEQLSDNCDFTLHLILAAGVVQLLYKYTERNDIVIGTPIYKQTMEAQFVNTILLLRCQLEDDATVKELLTHIGDVISEAIAHQNYPVEILIEDLNLQSSSYNNSFPLFDMALLLENIHDKEYINHVNPNILFSFNKRNGSINGVAEYNASLYAQTTIRRIITHLQFLLQEMLKNPDAAISGIDFLTASEKHQLLVEFNDTKTQLHHDKLIHVWFENQVNKTPGKIAVVFKREALTYRELNEKSNRLAHYLIVKGVERECIVGLMLGSSIEMIVGIIATLKAGAAYLPIDTKYPINRILDLVNDSNPSILLTESSTLKDFSITELLGIQAIKVEPQRTLPRPPADFNAFPKPDRSLIDYNRYKPYIGHAMVKHSIALQPTRGCPYHCAYCHRIWPKKHTFRSAENLLEEVELYYKMGVRRFIIIDDVFNCNTRNSSRFFELILKRGLKIHLFFPNGLRGDILTRDYIDLMVEAGTVNLDLALETASPRLQKLIKKNLDLDKLRENLEYLCTRHPHVIIDLGMMIGFPTETEEEAMKTMDFLKSIHWVHFPYPFILKIHPKTDIGKLALENGVPARAIARSMNHSYHDIPETLPFSKGFAREFKTKFLSDYFFLEERLLHVLPYQLKVASENELIQKYNNYLPMKIEHISDILEHANIPAEKLRSVAFLADDDLAIPGLNEKIKRHFPTGKKDNDALRVLLLDVSELFSSVEQDILHSEIPEPLGIMSLATYLHYQFGHHVKAKIAKSKVDFDSYDELKVLINDFSPGLIGIRTLSYYKDFFHRTVTCIRHWGIDAPIVAGGPYATMDYDILLQDPNINLVVLGEGEITFAELVGKMLENGKKFPGEEILQDIPGIAYIAETEKEKLKKSSREILVIDRIKERLALQPVKNLPITNKPADLVYVIYTSGSTGKPKGVMLEHRNLTNLMEFNFRFTNIDFSKIVQFHSISFDASFNEIFSALLSGGELFLIDMETRSNIFTLLRLVEENEIPTLFLPMSFLRIMFSEKDFIKAIPSCLRHIQTAGEQVIISNPFGEFLKENNVYLHNHYGPSETHVVTTLTLDPAGEIPKRPSIGKPILNTRIYILNQAKHLVPIGAVGELYIGGEQVGKGYLGRANLTSERFIPDPFEPGERLYRTGDLARWLADSSGNIEFLGRMDHQVKIRGFRVELGEIENQLLNHPGIKEAVVVAKWNDSEGASINYGGKYLCAYIVPDANVEFEISELRHYLSGSLPDYMLPSYFTQLEKIPLMPNGKIDLRALPAPEVKSGEGYIAPGNAVEEKLAAIWSEVLKLDKELISIDGNFFQLGGHSLKATVLSSRIHKELNIKIPLAEMFKSPTIRGMAKYITGAATDKFITLEPTEAKDYYAVSSAQKRLYLIQQIHPMSIRYNMPMALILEGDFHRDRLSAAFNGLVKRHDSLRTSFIMVGEEPVQRIRGEVDFEIEYYDISIQSIHAADSIIKNFIRPFDLAKAPMMRVGLIKLKEKEYILVVDMHHIITDEVSYEIFNRDLILLYSREKLIPLKLQYKDFSEWENTEIKKELLKKQEEYWLQEFKGEIPTLNFSTNYDMPERSNFEGAYIQSIISGRISQKLKDLNGQLGTTLFMFMLAVFYILLARYSGQEDIIIGSPVTGRTHHDLYNMIGMFVNMLALRNSPGGRKTFIQFVKEVRQNVLDSFENQDYQFDELVRSLGVQRKSDKNPLFNIVLAMQNMDTSEFEKAFEAHRDHLNLRPYDLNIIISRFDLNLFVREINGKIHILYRYSTGIFKEETIKKMEEHFIEIIDQVTDNPGIKLKEIILSSSLLHGSHNIKEKDTDFDF